MTMLQFALAIFVCGGLYQSVSALSLQDKQALIDIATAYPALQTASFGPWNISAPERACGGSWNGIVCSGENIVFLSWGLLALNNPLPRAIGNLTTLETLSVYSCGVNGTIPDEILRLPALSTLVLSANPITGTIPDFSNLPSLRMLQLATLQLNGPLPDSMWNLHLEHLELANLNITDLPAGVGNLVNLTYLSLAGIRWSSSIPAAVWNLPKLVELNINAGFTGAFPATVSLPSLVSLTLLSTKLSGSLPIGFTTPLEFMSLSSNAFISGTLPAEWGSISSLKTLSVTSCPLIYGPIPSSYGNLSNLKKMILSSNGMNGTVPSGIFDRLVNLDTLDLSTNYFSGSFPTSATEFSALPRLLYITLTSNRFTGSIGAFLAAPNLIKFEAGYNRFEGPWEVAGLPTKLTHFQAPQNRITRLPDNLGLFPMLKTLVLSYNRLSGTIPASLSNSTTITYLDLGTNTLSGDIPAFRRDRAWINMDFRSNQLSYCFIEPPSITFCYTDQNPNLCVCGRSSCSGTTCANCTTSNGNTICSLLPKPNGFPTTVPSRCESGISSNGHCCSSSCSSCQSCATGTCTAVPDGPFAACNVSCSNYVAGWSGLTCSVFREDLVGNCTAGVCSADLSRCSAEAGISLPTPDKTCGSASCQRNTASTCIPLTPKSTYATLSSICLVNETGSCATGNCDSMARCSSSPAQPPPVGSGAAPSGGASPTPSSAAPPQGSTLPSPASIGSTPSGSSPLSATPSSSQLSAASRHESAAVLFVVLVFLTAL